MTEPTFDIFKGTTDRDAMWLDAVEGLSSARQRMEQLATDKPGQYFVYAASSRAVLARIDTRKNLKSAGRSKVRGAA